MYLHLKSKHPDTFLVPCYDFDLVWHAHQLDPETYAADTKAILGKLMPHDDSVNDRGEGEHTPPSVALGTPHHHSCTRPPAPSTLTTLTAPTAPTAPTVPRIGSKLNNAAATTRRLWSAAFQRHTHPVFDESGCMFRGPPPPPPPSAEARAALDSRICGQDLKLTLSSATLVGMLGLKGKPQRDLKVHAHPNPNPNPNPNPKPQRDLKVHTHSAVLPSPLRHRSELPSNSLLSPAPLSPAQHHRGRRHAARRGHPGQHARKRRRAAARVRQEGG